MTKINVVCPVGMSGLAVEPWSKGEIYAVAANWAQANSPVLVYGEDGWTNDECGRQVADFRHNDRAALKAIIEEAIVASGDDVDDDEVDAILGKSFAIDDKGEDILQKISIYRDSVWAGDGVVDETGDIRDCAAVLGSDQDESDETYEAITDAINSGETSVSRPDGEYTWSIG